LSIEMIQVEPTFITFAKFDRVGRSWSGIAKTASQFEYQYHFPEFFDLIRTGMGRGFKNRLVNIMVSQPSVDSVFECAGS